MKKRPPVTPEACRLFTAHLVPGLVGGSKVSQPDLYLDRRERRVTGLANQCCVLIEWLLRTFQWRLVLSTFRVQTLPLEDLVVAIWRRSQRHSCLLQGGQEPLRGLDPILDFDDLIGQKRVAIKIICVLRLKLSHEL